MKSKSEKFEYRKARVRSRLRRTEVARPRLSVRRTSKYTYAQVIDDALGRTLAAASNLSPELRGKVPSGNKVEAARHVGALIAKKAIEAGVKQVVFDRGGRLYHGRVRALAEAARAGGLEF